MQNKNSKTLLLLNLHVTVIFTEPKTLYMIFFTRFVTKIKPRGQMRLVTDFYIFLLTMVTEVTNTIKQTQTSVK